MMETKAEVTMKTNKYDQTMIKKCNNNNDINFIVNLR